MNLRSMLINKKFISLLLFFSLFTGSVQYCDATAINKEGEVLIPVNEPVFIVVKGVFNSKEEAEKTRAFIQQLLVKTPGDGVIESHKLEGFPAQKWVVGSVFDSQEKAKWWMLFGDRNPSLPKAHVKATKLLESSDQVPYFPDPERQGQKRFFTEEEVLARLHQFPDVVALKQKSPIKVVFLSFPRTGHYVYDVEIMKAEGNQFVAYDFISLFAGNLDKYKRSIVN